MAARTYIALAFAVFAAAWGASAKVYIEFRPRMSMVNAAS